MDLLLYSKPQKVKMRCRDSNVNVTFMGVVKKIERDYVRRDCDGADENGAGSGRPFVRNASDRPDAESLNDPPPELSTQKLA
jgi:hypothetical protein